MLGSLSHANVTVTLSPSAYQCYASLLLLLPCWPCCLQLTPLERVKVNLALAQSVVTLYQLHRRLDAAALDKHPIQKELVRVRHGMQLCGSQLLISPIRSFRVQCCLPRTTCMHPVSVQLLCCNSYYVRSHTALHNMILHACRSGWQHMSAK